jgi:hypothetical protein
MQFSTNRVSLSSRPVWLSLEAIRRLVTSQWAIAFALFALSLSVRLGDLDAMVNSDIYYLWSARTVRFMEALRTGNWANTYQSHHPGVTLMWILGTTWTLFDLLQVPIQLHPEKVAVAVVPIVIIGSLFVALCYPVLLRLLGPTHKPAAGFFCLLLATEPLLVAHARNPHLDILANSFAWLAIFSALLARREASYRWALLGGVLLGLALMSKISTAGFALGIAAVFLVDCYRNPQALRRQLPLLAIIAVIAFVTVVLIWPALWAAPLETLARHRRGLTQEVEKAVPFMLFGKAGVQVVPWWVYGIFVVFLVTPEFWIPGILSIPLIFRAEGRARSAVVQIGIVNIPLLYLLFRSNNVGVRNTLLFLPLLALLTALAFEQLWRWLARQKALWLRITPLAMVGVLLVSRIVRLASLYPLPITYCSRWTTVECSTVFHLGWGEGMKEAAAFVDRYANLRSSSAEPVQIFGSGYAPVMATWTKVAVAGQIEKAELLVDYAPEWQRAGGRSKLIAAYAKEHELPLIHVVNLQGRDYVRIYRGPNGQ